MEGWSTLVENPKSRIEKKEGVLADRKGKEVEFSFARFVAVWTTRQTRTLKSGRWLVILVWARNALRPQPTLRVESEALLAQTSSWLVSPNCLERSPPYPVMRYRSGREQADM